MIDADVPENEQGINVPRGALERLLALAHSALRPDLLLVTISRRTADFWQGHTDTGPFELAARNAGKAGWFVTAPDGQVLVERRTVAPEYLGHHSTMAVEAVAGPGAPVVAAEGSGRSGGDVER